MGVDAFYRAFPRGEAAEALESAVPDFRVWPASHRECIEGKAVVIPLMKAFHGMFDGTFRWISRSDGDGASYLRWEGELAGVRCEGIDVLHVSPQDELTEIRVFIRPAEAVQAMTDAMVQAFGDWDNRANLLEGPARAGEA